MNKKMLVEIKLKRNKKTRIKTNIYPKLYDKRFSYQAHFLIIFMNAVVEYVRRQCL